MATGSVLRCHNLSSSHFMSQPHILYACFPPFSWEAAHHQHLFQFYQPYQELLSFCDLPLPYTIPYANYETPPTILPEGVQLELHTLPVDARAVADGDTISVYVNALQDPTQISLIPPYVLEAHLKRNKAKAMRNYAEADALQQIIINYGFRVIKFESEEVLVHKCRIRLRGIDAPESEMPYGKEATEELTKIVKGKCLRILVYEIDSYGRLVGDIYCDNNTFVQWENEAKVKQLGLWASSDPEEPWEWRKNQRNIATHTVLRHKYKKNIPPRLQIKAKTKN